jgi:hypothetical protein
VVDKQSRSSERRDRSGEVFDSGSHCVDGLEIGKGTLIRCVLDSEGSAISVAEVGVCECRCDG